MIFYSKLKTPFVPYYKSCSHSSLERYCPTTIKNFCIAHWHTPSVELSSRPISCYSQPKRFYYSHEDDRCDKNYRKGYYKDHYGKGYHEHNWQRSKWHESSYYKYLIPSFAIGYLKFIDNNEEIDKSYDKIPSKDSSNDNSNELSVKAKSKDNFSDNDKEIEADSSNTAQSIDDFNANNNENAMKDHSSVPNSSGLDKKENDNISKGGVNDELKINENKVDQNTNSQTLPTKSKKNIKTPESSLTRSNAINESKILLSRKLLETGAPGISIAVALNGRITWCEGFGFADLENHLKMGPDSIIRIASISKSITMAGVGKLIDEGKLDIDAPIQKYVPDFPVKYVNGEEVTITTRHLLSHTSGIRHYSLKEEINQKSKKNNCQKNKKKTDDENKENKNIENVSIRSKKERKLESMKKDIKKKNVQNVSDNEKDFKIVAKEKRDKIKKLLSDKMFKEENDCSKNDKSEFDLQEYYIKEHFNSVKESLELFKNDDLLFKPGEGYSYSTHGYTLVSAVVEGASGTSFTEFMKDLFKEMGLNKTYLDVNDDIIYKRARHYLRRRGILKNVPYVDNSYKWAGGGILSNVEDLVKFGNIMLYSSQLAKEEGKGKYSQRGFLMRSTMEEMWKPVPNTKMGWDKHGSYALGWAVVDMEENPAKYCDFRRFYISHTGGAIGASSVLLILPLESETKCLCPASSEGIVVAIISNMQNFAGINALALDIAKIFSRVENYSKMVGNLTGVTKDGVYLC